MATFELRRALPAGGDYYIVIQRQEDRFYLDFTTGTWSLPPSLSGNFMGHMAPGNGMFAGSFRYVGPQAVADALGPGYYTVSYHDKSRSYISVTTESLPWRIPEFLAEALEGLTGKIADAVAAKVPSPTGIDIDALAVAIAGKIPPIDTNALASIVASKLDVGNLAPGSTVQGEIELTP